MLVKLYTIPGPTVKKRRFRHGLACHRQCLSATQLYRKHSLEVAPTTLATVLADRKNIQLLLRV